MEEYNDGIKVIVADASHERYVDTILKTITDAAQVRGSGIASRTHEYVATKMKERKAIIALYGEEEEFAGFCYIESWENKHYVANSGLIVVPKFRGHHLATRIKRLAFGLTSSGAVMRINTSLGYVPVPFAELTQDDEYWKGCGTPEHPCCINCDVLARTGRKYCVCTGMLYDPARHPGEPLPVELPQDVIDFVRKAEAASQN